MYPFILLFPLRIKYQYVCIEINSFSSIISMWSSITGINFERYCFTQFIYVAYEIYLKQCCQQRNEYQNSYILKCVYTVMKSLWYKRDLVKPSLIIWNRRIMPCKDNRESRSYIKIILWYEYEFVIFVTLNYK